MVPSPRLAMSGAKGRRHELLSRSASLIGLLARRCAGMLIARRVPRKPTPQVRAMVPTLTASPNGEPWLLIDSAKTSEVSVEITMAMRNAVALWISASRTGASVICRWLAPTLRMVAWYRARSRLTMEIVIMLASAASVVPGLNRVMPWITFCCRVLGHATTGECPGTQRKSRPCMPASQFIIRTGKAGPHRLRHLRPGKLVVRTRVSPTRRIAR